MLYFKDHFEVRTHSVELVHFSEQYHQFIKNEKKSLDKINLCYIFNHSGNKSCCTPHTVFRIRWYWEQKHFQCCKILVTLYFKCFRMKFFAH